LGRLGYQVSRQTGSHIRLTTHEGGKHHITIPLHQELRVGTLSAILNEVSRHHSMTRDELLETLFPH
jgi:predicted RNA binding protein YcfA (HicA-like mRNA interferase family)